MNTFLRLLRVSALVAALFFCDSSLRLSAAETNAPVRKALIAARRITLPEFKCEGVTLTEAIQKLSAMSKQYDANHKGINYLLPDKLSAQAKAKVTLDLKNVTVAEVTEKLAKAADIRVQAEDYAYIFLPKGQ